VDSLARGGPWQLGTVLRGSCQWRTLSEAETTAYGGSAIRRLYGCAITMFKPDAHAPAASGFSDVRRTTEKCMGEMFEQQLFTWSQVCATGCAIMEVVQILLLHSAIE
jgi:hypothetical protein